MTEDGGMDHVGTGAVGDLTVDRWHDPTAPAGHEDVWRYEGDGAAVEMGWRRSPASTPNGFVYTGPELHGRDPPAEPLDPDGPGDVATRLRRAGRGLRDLSTNLARGARDWWVDETVLAHGDGDVAGARPAAVEAAVETVRERGIADADVTFVPREEAMRSYLDQQVAEAAVERAGGTARLGAAAVADERVCELCDPGTTVPSGVALADHSPSHITNNTTGERAANALPGVVRDGPPGANYLGVVAAGDTAVLHAEAGVEEGSLRHAVERGPFEGVDAVLGANAEPARETLATDRAPRGWAEVSSDRLADLVDEKRLEAVERAGSEEQTR